MNMIDRHLAAEQGREALEIIRTGGYVSRSGQRVSILEALADCVAATVNYPPKRGLPSTGRGDFDTIFEVRNESTLTAILRLIDDGLSPAALNFASAKNPGGGFLGGARAQEESLARASGLYAAIVDQPMYAHHRALRDALYTSWAIYSPGVPIFRGEDGRLLDVPRLCAFITSPAVNAKVVLEQDASRGDEITAAMSERVSRVLAIAAEHEHRALVLGAWGCGVFRNDIDEIAGLFHASLNENFRGAFERVVFAILDSSRDERFIAPFRSRFERPS
jgi:uncharacterized protein (TIGR02452 family)